MSLLSALVWFVVFLVSVAKAFDCSVLQQAVASHGPDSAAAALHSDPYFVNISSFQNESTYTYSPGKTYQSE